MNGRQTTLVLQRRIRKPSPSSLYCREVELHLSDDRRHLILSRYAELYKPDELAASVAIEHRVALKELLRWMISHGEAEPEVRVTRLADGTWRTE